MLLQRRRILFGIILGAGIFGFYFFIGIVFHERFNLPRPKHIFGSKEQLLIPHDEKSPPDTNPFANFARDEHPIGNLIKESRQHFDEYTANQSKSLTDAIRAYKQRYGRPPPPKFGIWYDFAVKRGSKVIDDFQQINDDIRPLWSVPPLELRRLAHSLPFNSRGVAGISIRDGKASIVEGTQGGSWRVPVFRSMFDSFAQHLPDIDIAMNDLDQPRLVVPWETIQKALKVEESTRSLPQTPVNLYSHHQLDGPSNLGAEGEWYDMSGKQFYETARLGCPPESSAPSASLITSDFAMMTPNQKSLLVHASNGFVSNFNLSSDLCHQPDLQAYHGFLIAPSTIVTSQKILPIFSESKVNVNNDILFPANMYWTKDERYVYDATNDVDWDGKRDLAIWRGITSGGVQVSTNWNGFHRHRMVMLSNSSITQSYDILLNDPKRDGKFIKESCSVSSFAHEHLDIGFTHIEYCVPNCSFLFDKFTKKPMTNLSEQFEDKVVVDVDGHSFSGRWRAFLQSKSLGLKATIFREWHDSRLTAWQHFVPMDNRFGDFYSILSYFFGLKDNDSFIAAHDEEARYIAEEGRKWAMDVLRNEDIEVYMFRLFLEYARVLDDKRDYIGH